MYKLTHTLLSHADHYKECKDAHVVYCDLENACLFCMTAYVNIHVCKKHLDLFSLYNYSHVH